MLVQNKSSEEATAVNCLLLRNNLNAVDLDAHPHPVLIRPF